MDSYSHLSEKEAIAQLPTAIQFRNCEIPLSGHIVGHIVGLALWHHGRFDHPVQAIGHITRLKPNTDGTVGVCVLWAGSTEEEGCHPGNLVYL